MTSRDLVLMESEWLNRAVNPVLGFLPKNPSTDRLQKYFPTVHPEDTKEMLSLLEVVIEPTTSYPDKVIAAYKYLQGLILMGGLEHLPEVFSEGVKRIDVNLAKLSPQSAEEVDKLRQELVSALSTIDH